MGLLSPSMKSGGSQAMDEASSGSCPAMADIMIAQSWADLANGPKESSDHDNGAQFDFVTSPCVGLCPMTPHKDAGIRIDPPVSEPMAMET